MLTDRRRGFLRRLVASQRLTVGRTALSSLRRCWPALASAGFLMAGGGLLGTAISLRVDDVAGGAATGSAILAAYYVGMLIGARACRAIVGQGDHAKTFALLCFAAAACALANGLFVFPLGWLLLRVGFGASLSCLCVLVESSICDGSDPGSLGWVTAAYGVVLLAAMAVGQLLLPLIGEFGVRPFAGTALALIMAPLPLLFAGQTRTGAACAGQLRFRRLVSRVPLAVAAAAASGIVSGALVTLTPLFGRSLGLSVSQTSELVAALLAGGALLQLPLGIASDRWGRSTVITLVAAGLVATGAACGALALVPAGLSIHGTMALLGGFAFALYPLALAQGNDRALANERVDVSAGLLTVWAVAATLGPPAGRWFMKVVEAPGLGLVVSLTGFALLCCQGARWFVGRGVRPVLPDPAC